MKWRSGASWLLLGVAIVYGIARGPLVHWTGSLWDYAVCAGSSYEWLHGRDPFDNARVIGGWMERGRAVDISSHAATLRAIVPPPTLVLLAPFAAMPQLAGAVCYLAASAALLAIAFWRCGRWAGLSAGDAWRVAAAAFVASVPLSSAALSGNPVLLAVPLILIGMERSLHGAPRLGGVLLGLGAALKIQIGGPLIVVVWLLGPRRAAAWAVTIAVAIAAIGAARSAAVGQNVWRAWAANVAETNVAGGLNDFARTPNAIDLLNLQAPLFHLTGSRTAADVIAFAIAGVLSIAAYLLLRSRRRDDVDEFVAVALAATLLLLPIYHRTYDGLVFLPALMVAMGSDRHTSPRIVLMVALAAMLVPPNVVTRIVQLHVLPATISNAPAFLAIVGAHKAWATLAVALVLLVIFREQKGGADAGHAARAAVHLGSAADRAAHLLRGDAGHPARADPA